MRDAGLGEVTVYGVEGPGWAQVKAVEQHTGQMLAENHPAFEAALRAARLADGHPDLLAAASHLLAVARR